MNGLAPQLYGRVAVVLYASVRVVDEPSQLVGRSLRDGHPEGLQRVFRLQRLGQAPAHYLMQVGIRHQVQVAAVVRQVDILDVAHPQLIGTCRHEAADDVLVIGQFAPVKQLTAIRYRVARIAV